MPKGPDWSALFAAATLARGKAYAPYSKFHVGAALLMADGGLFCGCNVENASYGLSMCAERNALGAAILHGSHKLSAVAIVADGKTPCPPCGACRQMMAEFGAPSVPVKLRNLEGAEQSYTLGELLPHAFGPTFL
jgi:cytidine deaminase